MNEPFQKKNPITIFSSQIPFFLRSGPAVSSALDNVALSLGDVIDAATQESWRDDNGWWLREIGLNRGACFRTSEMSLAFYDAQVFSSSKKTHPWLSQHIPSIVRNDFMVFSTESNEDFLLDSLLIGHGWDGLRFQNLCGFCGWPWGRVSQCLRVVGRWQQPVSITFIAYSIYFWIFWLCAFHSSSGGGSRWGSWTAKGNIFSKWLQRLRSMVSRFLHFV